MNEANAATEKKSGFSGMQVLVIVLVTILLTIGITVWIVRTYVFPGEFKPVELNAREQQVLEDKLGRLESFGARRGSSGGADVTDMTPEPYSEENANREIFFTEKELNGLIASETELATRVAVDLSDDLASAKVLIPVDPDFPVLGGKTLRVNAGVELAYTDGRPIVVLRGISVMGVPVPNAWLGNLKNVDLVQQFGSDAGFWKAFADGVEFIRVEDGELLIKLRE